MPGGAIVILLAKNSRGALLGRSSLYPGYKGRKEGGLILEITLPGVERSLFKRPCHGERSAVIRKYDEDAELLVDTTDPIERLVGHPPPARIDRSLLADPSAAR